MTDKERESLKEIINLPGWEIIKRIDKEETDRLKEVMIFSNLDTDIANIKKQQDYLIARRDFINMIEQKAVSPVIAQEELDGYEHEEQYTIS